MPKYAKKVYALVADTIRRRRNYAIALDLSPRLLDELASDFAQVFRQDNYNFNSEQFLRESGGDE